jgi:2,4-dienoyl-CoA reductase-like NADH-dependent reductase (Old Yellow Enzyme family)
MSVEPLFRPFRYKGLTLPNRIVMAPMTRGFSPGGVPTDAVAGYYARRARGGVGLIISEGTGVGRPGSLNGANFPRFHGQDALAGWKKVLGDVHAAGGRIAPQLWHVGAVPAPYGDGPSEDLVESPSGLSAPGAAFGRAMTDSDIADTIAAFGRAAADAKALGFDAVELHGAHGYLIDQFFWAEVNRRTDRYNGPSINARTRFAAEVVAAVRQTVGPGFPIILRLSQWKQQDYTARLALTPDEMARWLEPLVEAGADVLHCSQRRIWEPEFPEVDGVAGLNFAGWAKKLTGAVTISVGSVGLSNDAMSAFQGEGASVTGIERVLERLARDEFDLVAVGRALLGDPLWAQKIRAGSQDLHDFTAAQMSELT